MRKTKVMDPKPIYTGRVEKKEPIFYFPDAETAEDWHRQNPQEHHLRAKTSVGNLQSHSTIKIKKTTEEDLDLPEWEVE